jgi:hypothetical protein
MNFNEACPSGNSFYGIQPHEARYSHTIYTKDELHRYIANRIFDKGQKWSIYRTFIKNGCFDVEE